MTVTTGIERRTARRRAAGRWGSAAVVAGLAAVAGCATGGTRAPAGGPAAADAGTEARDSAAIRNVLHGTPGGAWRSTYEPLPSRTTLIRDGTVMTAAGREIEGGDVLLRDGKIAAVGADVPAPDGARVVDASGRFVTPGIIDTHSHMGDYPDPEVQGHYDGNEATDPTTPDVWAEHSVFPQDPSFTRALAGGVTTVQVLPGSANLIGGRGITLKMVPSRTVQGMMFPDAPMALKMACGENPKRVYREEGPSTRMGNVAGYREAYVEAQAYRETWDAWVEDGATGEPPERDLALETLAEVLRGEILVHMHCYRADEMAQMIQLGREFGFKVRNFHHATSAYKVRDLLAEEGIGASVWYDWWGFKMEAFDAIPQNLALVSEAGAPAILHTDSDLGVQIMNQNAARAMYDARAHGMDVSRDEALRWITANPAWSLGLEDRVGTLEEGKNADVVVWSADPFSVYARADQVYVDGALVYDRSRSDLRPTTDFEAGILPDRVQQDERGGDR